MKLAMIILSIFAPCYYCAPLKRDASDVLARGEMKSTEKKSKLDAVSVVLPITTKIRYICKECSFSTDDVADIMTHVMAQHGRILFACVDNDCNCGNVYYHKQGLKLHVYQKTGVLQVKKQKKCVLLINHVLYNELDFEACEKAGISRQRIDTMTVGVSQALHWICYKAECGCIHQWSCAVNKRANRGTGCPQCANNSTKVCFHKSVLYKCPGIVNQWHPTLNGDLDPSTISWASHTKVWFICICECGIEHVWQKPVQARTSSNKHCLKCTVGGNEVCECKSLGHLNPQLCSEIDFENDPKLALLNESERRSFVLKLPTMSHKKLLWKCVKNSAHLSWYAPIYSRNGVDKRGCASCQESKAENRMAVVLNRMGIAYTREYKLPEQKRGGFDFWLNGTRTLIEMDGRHHFEGVTFGTSRKTADECFKDSLRRDVLKNALAEKNNYHLLRIPHTHDKEEQIREILETYMTVIDDTADDDRVVIFVNKALYDEQKSMMTSLL